MSDSPQIVSTLKAKAMLLIQREREIFSLRLGRERMGGWLQAFHRLSARARPESGESMCVEWTAAMIEERHFQSAVAFRHHLSTGDLFLIHGQSHTRLPEKLSLDEAARRALRERREGLFDRSQDPDGFALGECLHLRCFVWFTFPVDEQNEILLAAGVAKGIGGAQGSLSEDDLGYFTMVGQHLAALLTNYRLISALGSATRNLQELFDHMRQAIVAFDATGSICGVPSRQARILFEHEHLDGCSVRDLLYPGAPAYDVDAASFSEWVEFALQTAPADWPSCERLAPREAVVVRKDGTHVLLELEFRPLVRDGITAHLMMLASDVTAARKLEGVVRTQEALHAKQLAAMRQLVAGGAQVFLRFIDSARERVRRCEAILREHPGPLGIDTVDELFRQAHTIRGEARAFDLLELESAAAGFEDVLDKIRSAAHEAAPDGLRASLGRGVQLVGESLERGCYGLVAASPAGVAILDQATVPRSALRALTEYAGQRTDALGTLVAGLTAVPFGMTTAGVVESAAAWAAMQGNTVAVLVNPRELMVPRELARVLPGVLTHLVRNAIAHGIESPDERRAAGKAEQGTIRLVAEQAADGVRVIVEDDGRGLDVARIRERSGLGAYSGDASDLVFAPGLSTRQTPDALAGRGVGLDAVRRELAIVRYSITLSFAAGQWTRFTLLPLNEIRASGE